MIDLKDRHDHDGFYIELGEVKKVTIKKDLPPDSLRWVFHDEVKGLPLYISWDAWEAMWQHAFTASNNEVGGFLLGGVYDDGQEEFVEIATCIQARHTKERVASLTFTHQTWIDLDDRVSKKYPDLSVIGWYHTHPGYGVFLSGHDLFIHKNFFNEREQLAVVLDPKRQEEGFFHWYKGEIKKANSVWLFSNDRVTSDEIASFIERAFEDISPVKQRFFSNLDRPNDATEGFNVVWENKSRLRIRPQKNQRSQRNSGSFIDKKV